MSASKDIKKYFANIRDAVVTTFKGMRITLKYWVKEPSITVEYPDRFPKGKTMDDFIAERFRGFLGFEAKSCIGCMQCSNACPIDCIKVGIEKSGGVKTLVAFDVNQARCMHCGLCVEACPTGAVFFTRKFEASSFDIRELCFRHVSGPVALAGPGAKKSVKDAEA